MSPSVSLSSCFSTYNDILTSLISQFQNDRNSYGITILLNNPIRDAPEFCHVFDEGLALQMQTFQK